MKQLIAYNLILAYFNFELSFDDYQLGTVILQNDGLIAFFSKNLNSTERQYTITEKELLSTVESLRKFKGILLKKQIKLYTDHKNLL